MTSFRNNRHNVEQDALVKILNKVASNSSFTQRSLAQELGIALGLMNQYLKRCIKKGWVRASQVSPHRISYFLTIEGFQEKSHMIKDYLTRSLTFFRDARAQCEAVFTECKENGWTSIALMGASDLADIAMLVAQAMSIKAKTISINANIKNYDAVLITDIINPQNTYDKVKDRANGKRIFTLQLLHISKKVIA